MVDTPQTNSCKSIEELPQASEFNSTDTDYSTATNFWVVAKVNEKHSNVWVMNYLESNVFWDETDQIVYPEQKLIVYRVKGDEGIQVGDKVLMNLDTRLWTLNLKDVEQYCLSPFRVYGARTIQPETFNWRISLIESMQKPLFLTVFFIAILMIVPLSVYLERRKKSKSK